MPLIFKDKPQSNELIKQIASLKNYRDVRLSFAGGEPLLDKRLTDKISFANENNLKVSLITNGDLLTEDFLYENCLKIDMIGISIDSFNDSTNLSIGRATSMGHIPDYKNIAKLMVLAKKINPNIKIKINTVVNQFNFNENMSDIIQFIKPDKWKIFRVLPATEKSKSQEISNNKFETFINQHKHIECTSVEDNNTMFNSYLMIDPYGRFFYNKTGGGYGYSQSILNTGITKALETIDFDYKKFTNRYL
jgi:radical S-adenosyl methionine domain-containing protein 2